jgi:hypothetical protein
VKVINPGIIASEIRTTQTIVGGMTGNRLKVMGTQVVTFNVGIRTFTHEFLVASLDTEYSGILGVDALRHMGVLRVLCLTTSDKCVIGNDTNYL